MQSTTLILNVGYDSLLLDTRTRLLRGAGYTVVPTRHLESIVTSLQTVKFDLIVLCHSLSSAERTAIAKVLKDDGSSIPVFLVDPVTSVDSPIETTPAVFLRRVSETVRKNRLRD